MKRPILLVAAVCACCVLSPATVRSAVLDTAEALWKFDHADSGSVTAGQIVDSNNGNDATSIQGDAGNLHWSTTPLSGTSIAGSVDPFGDHGRGLVFDQQLVEQNPDQASVSAVRIDDFRLNGPATFRTRLRWDGYISDQSTSAWIYANGSYSGGWLFGIRGGSPHLQILHRQGGATASSLPVIEPDTWYDIAVVIDGAGDDAIGEQSANFSFYLLPEGGQLQEVTLTGRYGDNASGAGNALIGGETAGIGGGNRLKSFDGTIDYFAIWNQALSRSEVRSTMVPEPSAGLLLAIGLAGVVLGGRRRRRGLPLFC
jgi:hypothetical protein